MARKAIGISTSSVTWEPLKSEIDISDKGEATITVYGVVDSRNTSAYAALLALPNELPVSSSGPVGNATDLSGAKVTNKRASGGDCCWEVTATYKKSTALTADYDGTQRANEDRASRRIIVTQEPLLSHPVVRSFPRKERNKLKALQDGIIQANPGYDPEGSGDALREFILIANDGTESEALFSDDDVTADEISASPLDYARFLKAGIEFYNKQSIRHVWSTSRNSPAPNTDYQKVGEVVGTPPLAPTLAGGFQWMNVGINDDTENGDTWSTSYEFDASGPGGYLRGIYKGGTAEIDEAP